MGRSYGPATWAGHPWPDSRESSILTYHLSSLPKERRDSQCALWRQSPNGGYISTCVLFWPEACISPSFLGVAIVAILYLGGGLKPAAFLLF